MFKFAVVLCLVAVSYAEEAAAGAAGADAVAADIPAVEVPVVDEVAKAAVEDTPAGVEEDVMEMMPDEYADDDYEDEDDYDHDFELDTEYDPESFDENLEVPDFEEIPEEVAELGSGEGETDEIV